MGNPVFLDLRRGEANPTLQNIGVSVVIPTHNRLDDLDLAVASVLGQGVECEVIVIDDGSNPPVAPVGALKNDAVQIIRNDSPVGPCRARAQGIERASGAYIAFLDDDDVWLPEKLSRSLRVIAEVPDARVVVHRTGFDLRQVNETPDVARIEENPLYLYGRERTPHLNSVLVDTELARMVGFDENFYACSDIDFVIGLARHTSFAMINDVLALRGKDTAPSAIAIERRIEGRNLLSEKHRDVFNVDSESKAFQDVRMAHLYRRSGHRVKALGCFARALGRRPNYADAWHGAGITILPPETGKYLSVRRRLKAVPAPAAPAPTRTEEPSATGSTK